MSMDWIAVRSRLEAAEAALEGGWRPSEGERREILKARALELAREEPPEGAAEGLVEVVVFRLAAERYAVEYSFVREIHPLMDFTSLPGAPPFVLGIVNLRGRIVSIVDLRRFFDLPAKGLGQLNKLIVLRDEEMEFGVLADELLGVQAIRRADIQAPPPTLTGVGAEYMLGIAASGICLLDAKTILGDGRIVVCDD